MRRLTSAISVSLLAIALVGCGKTAPNGTLGVSAAAPVAAPQAAQAPVKAQPKQTAIAPSTVSKPALVSNNGSTLTVPETAEVTLGADSVDLEVPPVGTPTVLGDDPVSMSAMAEEEAPSYKIDDRTPYGVVVAERTATTATFSWNTEVPTRGIIQYGRTWGFDKNGFTDSYKDDVPNTSHKITVTGLRRFTSYTFKITAVTPLGLKFSDNTNRTFRTKFWSWR
jgi:hypothetical protein